MSMPSQSSPSPPIEVSAESSVTVSGRRNPRRTSRSPSRLPAAVPKDSSGRVGSKAEDLLSWSAVEMNSGQWSVIRQCIPGQSALACRNRYSILKKKRDSENEDSETEDSESDYSETDEELNAARIYFLQNFKQVVSNAIDIHIEKKMNE